MGQKIKLKKSELKRMIAESANESGIALYVVSITIGIWMPQLTYWLREIRY